MRVQLHSLGDNLRSRLHWRAYMEPWKVHRFVETSSIKELEAALDKLAKAILQKEVSEHTGKYYRELLNEGIQLKKMFQEH